MENATMFPETIMQRVFCISYHGKHYSGGLGTGFTINDNSGEEYLITARHVVNNMIIGGDDVLYYMRNGLWEYKHIKLLNAIEPPFQGGDLAVISGFDLSKTLSPPAKPLIDFDKSKPELKVHWNVGDEVYFYGFPLGFRVDLPVKMNNGFPAPLIKIGRISGVTYDEKNVTYDPKVEDVNDIYVDAFVNQGFSGGPLFCKNGEKLSLIGVVRGFHKEFVEGNPNPSNSGIMVASSIWHVLNLISDAGI